MTLELERSIHNGSVHRRYFQKLPHQNDARRILLKVARDGQAVLKNVGWYGDTDSLG
jgi:hypothetical protein